MAPKVYFTDFCTGGRETLPKKLARLILTAVSYGFMILALYRCFSRNTYKRYRENRRSQGMMEQHPSFQ